MPTAKHSYPHFICIGPAKSATTWLADHLKLQFDMWFPPIQEISYPFLSFGNREDINGQLEYRYTLWEIFKRVVRNKSFSGRRDRRFYALANELARTDPDGVDFEGYRRIFRLAEGKITGDISPIYASFTTEKIETIKAKTDCRVVFMFLRDPVSRFFSHYKMMERYRKFGDVDYGSVDTVKKFLYSPVASRQFYPSLIYGKWEAVWGGQFKFFDFDDVVADPENTLKRIISHVGGNPRARIPFIPASINRNVAHQSTPLTQEAEYLVHEHFLAELEACCDVFGKKAEGWLARSRKLLQRA